MAIFTLEYLVLVFCSIVLILETFKVLGCKSPLESLSWNTIKQILKIIWSSAVKRSAYKFYTMDELQE